jgi:hypothetical protein
MKSQVFKLLALTTILFSSSTFVHAAKYNLCVNCANGAFAVGSPTPNPGGSYGNSVCASHNAGALISITTAKKFNDRYLCISKAKVIDGIKVIPKDSGLNPALLTDPVKDSSE